MNMFLDLTSEGGSISLIQLLIVLGIIALIAVIFGRLRR